MAKHLKLVVFKKRVADRQVKVEEIKKAAKHAAVDETTSFIPRTHLTPVFKEISQAENSMIATLAHDALQSLAGGEVGASFRILSRSVLEKAMSDMALTMASDPLPEGITRHDAKDYMDMLIAARDNIDWNTELLAVTTS